MDRSRRRFIKTAGLAVAGLGGVAAAARAAMAGLPGAAGFAQPEGGLRAGRWAMAIDTARCLQKEGCRACIDACHAAHNVPDVPGSKEEMKWIWKMPFEHAFPERLNDYVAEEIRERPVLAMCNHCDNPACVRVCPTQATWKRSDGIVMMDMHRCVGCRYCMVGCPYGARSFNWRDPRQYLKEPRPDYPTRRKGVVEKCTFCEERLAKGQLPACVEACAQVVGQSAMAFGDVSDARSEVGRLVREGRTIRRKVILGTNPQVYYLV
jgi:molybdopterin-containing oxidoreductase family iron-sulfur binding subunit